MKTHIPMMGGTTN